MRSDVSEKMNMVDVAQLVSAPDCGSGGRGFESLHPPHSFLQPRLRRGSEFVPPPQPALGCSQAVRQRTLTPSCVGSNPAIPANDPLAQSAEHLPFKQGVWSSNLQRVTKNPECESIQDFYLLPLHSSLLLIIPMPNHKNRQTSIRRLSIFLLYTLLGLYAILVEAGR